MSHISTLCQHASLFLLTHSWDTEVKVTISRINSWVWYAGYPQAGQHQPVQHHHNHVLPAAGACYTPHWGSQVHPLCHEGHGHCQHHRGYQEDLASWPLLPFLPTGEAQTCLVCSVLKYDIGFDMSVVITLLKTVLGSAAMTHASAVSLLACVHQDKARVWEGTVCFKAVLALHGSFCKHNAVTGSKVVLVSVHGHSVSHSAAFGSVTSMYTTSVKSACERACWCGHWSMLRYCTKWLQMC